MSMTAAAFDASNRIVQKMSIYNVNLGHGQGERTFLDVNHDGRINVSKGDRTGWTTFEDSYREPQFSEFSSKLAKRRQNAADVILTQADVKDVQLRDGVECSYGNTIYTPDRATYRTARELTGMVRQMGYNPEPTPDPTGRLLGTDHQCGINLSTWEFIIYAPK